MKRLGLILISVALCVSLITSCAPENEIDEVVDMKFDVSKLETRTLNQSVEAFKSNNLYWMYEAKKIDATSYTTGQTKEKTKLANGTGTSAKLTLSAGKWEFKLYGYKDSGYSHLAYEGKTQANVSGNSTTVAISVHTLQTTGKTGKLIVSKDVLASVKDAEVTISLILDDGEGNNTQTWAKGTNGYENISFDVNSGRHHGTIEVTAEDRAIVYSNEGIDFDIYDNLTTTIGGLLSGETTEVNFSTSVADGINKTETKATVENGKALTVKASSSVSTSGEGNTEVEFPTDVLNQGEATVTITTYDTIAVQKAESKPKFAIENNNSVIGGLDLTVKQGENTVSSFNSPVTVKTYIGEGLAKENISLFYDKQDGTKEEITSFEYDATTGILSFTTTHFSRYYILISNDYLAVGKSGKYYTELPTIIEEEVTFLPQNREIDLENSEYTISGFVFPESDKEYTVTIKNGTIKGSNRVAAFTQYENSHLILDNVKIYYSAQAVCFLYQGSNPVWLEVKNSTLTNNVYGIGTNASLGTDKVYVTIENSSVTTESSDQDNTAILFNVPGELNISKSTISGERQGAIVRGGNATISSSTIEAKGTKSTYNDWLGTSIYNNNNWGDGNRVPLAALVVGNASKNAYKYSTDVKFEGDVILKASEYRDNIYKAEVEGYPVTISGSYKTDGGRTHINSLAEAFNVDFGCKENKATATDIIIDGEGKYVVDKWQDLWFSGNVSITGVEFSKGITLSVNKGTDVKNESTITFENCVVYGCNQEELTEEMRTSPNSSNYNNAGNGLGLSINGNTNENFINVKVSNCYFVGDGDTTKPRKDSYSTISEHDSKSNAKGRSNGIGLGTTPGQGKSFKYVSISTSYFTNHRNASIQLYTFTNNVDITNCIFKSWGVNSEDAREPSFAIRGDSPNGDSVNLTIEGCKFKKNNNICSVDRVTPTIIK